MTSTAFLVPGIPVTQGSMQMMPTRHGPRVTHVKAVSLRSWRRTVAICAAGAGCRPRPGAFAVELLFLLPHVRPLTEPPDLDKLVRAVKDALTGFVWLDDSQVVDLYARKRHESPGHPPGVLVMVTPSPLAE